MQTTLWKGQLNTRSFNLPSAAWLVVSAIAVLLDAWFATTAITKLSQPAILLAETSSLARFKRAMNDLERLGEIGFGHVLKSNQTTTVRP